MFDYNSLTPNRRYFVDLVYQEFSDITDQITRDQINHVITKHNVGFPQWLTISSNKQGKSVWGFPTKTDSKGDPMKEIPQETDEDIATRIRDTYESMQSLVASVSANVVNSLIVSGAPGIGKSHTVEKTLLEVNGGSEYNFVFHKGYLRASHLFRLLWENRYPGMVIVIDDCDAIFNDETALNILKAALELKPSRHIGWGSEKEFSDQDGETIPRYFSYEGSIIFLTNKDIRGEIASNSKNAPHLSALESRSLLLDMKIKTKREYMIKIKQTVEQGMLRQKGFSALDETQIMNFVEEYKDSLTELSLRMVEKIAALYRSNPSNWEKLVRSVCFK